MKTIIKAFLCGVAFVAGAIVMAAAGAIFTTTTGSGFRPDAQVELQGTSGVLSIATTQNPGAVNSNESAIAYMAYDASGNVAKTASESSKWADATAGTGYGVLRFNATYNAGTADDVAMRIYGNRGISLWSLTDSANCSYQTLCMTGVLQLNNPRVTAARKSLFSWNDCVYWRDTNGTDWKITGPGSC